MASPGRDVMMVVRDYLARDQEPSESSKLEMITWLPDADVDALLAAKKQSFSLGLARKGGRA
eukprot:15432337-Alexandrium_andersonii.AAC.1